MSVDRQPENNTDVKRRKRRWDRVRLAIVKRDVISGNYDDELLLRMAIKSPACRQDVKHLARIDKTG